MRYWRILVLLTFSLVSCKRSKDEEKSLFILKINFLAGSQPLSYSSNFPFGSGFVRFVQARFYVAVPSLVTSQNDTVAFPDTYAILDSENNLLIVGEVPARQYKTLMFGLGVDRDRNTQFGSKAIPATEYPMDHPLSASHGLYWGWNPGYIFGQFDGRYDTNGNQVFTDPTDILFSYHPGTDKLYRTIIRPTEVKAHGQKFTLTLNFNLLKCLEAVDILTHPHSHPVSSSDPEFPAAKAFVDAYEEAFSQVTVE